MSFLSSVLSSIETGNPAAIPPPAPVTSRSPAPGSSSAAAKAEVRRATPGSRDAPLGDNTASAGMKRKAEEPLHRPDKPDGQIIGRHVSAKTPTSHISPAAKARPASVSGTGGSKPAVKPSTAAATVPSQRASPATVASKPPPKGSFADLMLKAKAAQEKAPVQVGMFKHQAVPKERLSKAERKKRAMEAMAKEREAKLGKKSGAVSSASAGLKAGKKPGDEAAIRRREPEEHAYKGTARPTQPVYKGTADLSSRRSANEPRGRAKSRYGRPSRRDEYLGTDEEDEGDYADDFDNYDSDASSDMEAGLEDVEEEEAAALRVAKKEDEADIRAEMAAKREKLERRKKLASLAAKSKR